MLLMVGEAGEMLMAWGCTHVEGGRFMGLLLNRAVNLQLP